MRPSLRRYVAARIMPMSFASRRETMRGIIMTIVLAGSMAFGASAAEAKGCIKGAIVGGVAGHYAHHHALAGAAAGCVAGHYYAKHKAQQQAAAAAAQHPAPVHH
jgi:uncharacterized protein YaiE (UPF0345 family)